MMDAKISIKIPYKFSASSLSGLRRMIRRTTTSSTMYYLSFFNEKSEFAKL